MLFVFSTNSFEIQASYASTICKRKLPSHTPLTIHQNEQQSNPKYACHYLRTLLLCYPSFSVTETDVQQTFQYHFLRIHAYMKLTIKLRGFLLFRVFMSTVHARSISFCCSQLPMSPFPSNLTELFLTNTVRCTEEKLNDKYSNNLNFQELRWCNTPIELQLD